MNRTLLGRYALIGELGRGTSGRVYSARHCETGDLVAVKLLPDLSPSSLYELKQEFRVVRAIYSPHLVPVHDVGVEEGTGYLVMSLVGGVSLDQWSQTTPWRRQPARLYRVLRGALAAMVELHRAGLVHRDIKPANLIVRHDDHVVLVDFGGAISSRAGNQLAAADRARFTGTLAYTPPEALFGGRPSPEQDVFAFGVLLFELITQLPVPRQPWSWEVVEERVRELACAAWHEMPSELMSLLEGALTNRPNHRISAPQALASVAQLARAPLERATFLQDHQQMFGREREIAALLTSLECPGNRVGVVGPCGIGKTALLHSALAQLPRDDGPDWLILTSCCHPGEHLPFGMLDEAIDAVCGYLLGRAFKLEQLIDAQLTDVLVTAFPVLRQVTCDVALRACESAHVDSRAERLLARSERRQRLGAALAALLLRLAERHRLVLWIDDVHWADQDGLRLLVEVLASPNMRPMTLLVTGRELPAALAELLTQQLILGPLEEHEARRLVSARFEAREQDEQFSGPRWNERSVPAWVLDAGCGNPALLGQLAGYVSNPGAAFGSLQAVMRHRLAELPASAVYVAQAMSLLGHAAPAAVARSIAGHADYIEVMHALSCAGLVRPAPAFGERGFALAHDSLRQSILKLLDLRAKADLHGRLVDALEQYPATPPELLATHCEGAGAPQRAGELLLQAGKRALDGLAFEHAVRCLERACALISSAKQRVAMELLARALALAGRAREAANQFLSCAAAADADARDAYLLQAANHLFLTGENEHGIALVNQLLSVHGLRLPTSLGGVAFGLLAQRVRRALTLGNPPPLAEARQPHACIADLAYSASAGLSHADVMLGAFIQKLHLQHAYRSRSPERIARALALEAGFSAASGAPERQTNALLDQARRQPGAGKNPRLSALFPLVAAISAWAQGRWSRCAEEAEEVERQVEENCPGSWWELGLARSVLLDALRWSGRYHELAERTARYLRDADVRGDRFAGVTFRARFDATLKLLAGDPHGAWKAADHISAWPSRSVHLQHLAALHSRAECYLYVGQCGEALAYVQSELARFRAAPILRSVPPRVKLFHQLACCRLAVAATLSPAQRSALLASTRRDLRPLLAARWGYASLLASIVEVTVDALRGQQVGARLDQLRARAHALQMPQYASALGLAASRSATERSEHLDRLGRLGATEPQRWAAQLLPGLVTVARVATSPGALEPSARQLV